MFSQAEGCRCRCFISAKPTRFLKAFTQWKSSWLSREAVISTVTLAVTGVQALLIIFANGNILLGVAAAALCLGTVFCTAMIYTQLKTVPRWNHALTPVQFLLFAIAGGTLLAGEDHVAMPVLAALACVQMAAWLIGDQRISRSGSTIETATGLDGPGVRSVRLLEPPHTGGNYLTREMVFVIGRRHSRIIRSVSIACIGILPLFLLAMPIESAWVWPSTVVLHVSGAVLSRWLFFAEAEHVVGLYYGRHGRVTR